VNTLACNSFLHILAGQSACGGHSGIKTKSASLVRAATRARYLQEPPSGSTRKQGGLVLYKINSSYINHLQTFQQAKIQIAIDLLLLNLSLLFPLINVGPTTIKISTDATPDQINVKHS
jgi:hypothetical protein